MVLTDVSESNSRPITPLSRSGRSDSNADDDTSEAYPEESSGHSSPLQESEKDSDEPKYLIEECIPEGVRPSWSRSSISPPLGIVRSPLPQSPASVHSLLATSFHLLLKSTSPQLQPCEKASIPDPAFQRCDEFFFEDANIVLVSDKNVAFGVHRGIMKRLSTVFSHMFQDVQATSDMEMFQGLPFVRLSDTTEDLLTFFQVIYDQRTIESIEAPHKRLLTFCDKYGIDSVIRKILACLLHSFPDTLESWKIARDKGKTEAEEVVNVVMAAFKMDIKIFLPSCLYTIMVDFTASEEAIEKLPKELLIKYHRGFVGFSAYTTNFYCDTLCRRVSPPKGCNKAKCKEIWSSFRTRVQDTYLQKADHILCPNPLRYLRELSQLAVSPHGESHLYCDRCRVALLGVFENAAEEVWNSLPRMFGIANDWGILRQKYLH